METEIEYRVFEFPKRGYYWIWEMINGELRTYGPIKGLVKMEAFLRYLREAALA